MFLTAGSYSAEYAHEVGLVDAKMPAEALDEYIEGEVDLLTRAGPAAIAACKELLSRVRSLPRDEVDGYTAELIARLRSSPEGREGVTAFLEKRKPAWHPEA
jgi:methylglutaconyl-CoA hydratase